jgi:hypothetical protein
MSGALPEGLLAKVADELTASIDGEGVWIWDDEGRAWRLLPGTWANEMTLTPLSQDGDGRPIKVRLRVETF